MKNMKLFFKTSVLWVIFLFLIFPLAFSFANGISLPNPVAATSASNLIEIVISYIVSIIGYLAVLALLIAGTMYLFAGTNDKAMQTAKGFFYGSILGLGLAAAGPTLLQTIKKIVLKGDVMPKTLDEAKPLTDIITDSIKELLLIFGILAIIGIVIGGLLFLTAAGKPNQAEKATNMIKYSIIGVAVAGGAIIITQQIANFFK